MGVAFDQPPGAFVQRSSQTSFGVSVSAGAMTQSAERNGIRAEYPVSYIVGSGSHAYAYLIRISDFLFQSPISFYTKRGLWDMAPGFETDRQPDFTRPIGPECLLCHAGSSLAAAGVNRFRPPYIQELAISCDRCHGAVDAHLRSPSRSNIFNPARLPVRARDSICEQCHLTGEARVPNPGKTLSDFRVGQDLESAFSVYVFDAGERSTSASAASESAIKVVSHAEQLRKSLCARSSGGQLWCGTCHDPHNVPADKRAFYRDRCLACHSAQQLARNHSAAMDDCVACHMPSRPARDGGHTAFTDHRIVKRQEPGREQQRNELVAWREPDPAFAMRNRALAYLAVGERNEDEKLLTKAFQGLFEIESSFGRDAEVLNGLGILLLRRGRPADSVLMLERALDLVPMSATYRINLATAMIEKGDLAGAVRQLNRSIELDPSLEVAYRRLVEIYGRLHDTEGVNKTFARYLAFRPQSIDAREALRRR